MKNNFTIFAQKNLKLLALGLFSVLLVNCSKDDDGPVTYEFTEFENLSALPEVEDTDPVFTDPDLGSVKASAATQAMINDFQDGGDLSQTTKDNLTAVSDFSDGLTLTMDNEAATLDAAGIDAILNSAELTGDYAALAAELENLPASVAALFPSLIFSDDYNRAQEQLKAGIVINDLMSDLMSQTNEGPCYDAALAAYSEAMKTPIAKRDVQLSVVNTNYDNRVTAADTRYTDREAALNTAIDGYKAEIKATAVAIIAYSDSIKDTDAALAGTLRTYALFYVIKSYTLLNTFKTEAISLLDDTKAAELARVEAIKIEKNELIQSNFATVKAEADAKLNTAYGKCHNQGSGS